MGVALEVALNCAHGRSVLVVLARALAAGSNRLQIDDEWLHFVYVTGPLVPFVVRGDLEQSKQSWCMGLSCPASNDQSLWLSKEQNFLR